MTKAWQPSVADSERCADEFDFTKAYDARTLYIGDLKKRVYWKLLPYIEYEWLYDTVYMVKRAIIRLVRSLNGADAGAYGNHNPNLIEYKGRLGRYFQSISWLMCTEPLVKAYVEEALQQTDFEQQMFKIYVLLKCNPLFIHAPFSRGRGNFELAALITRIGLEKFIVCTEPNLSR